MMQLAGLSTSNTSRPMQLLTTRPQPARCRPSFGKLQTPRPGKALVVCNTAKTAVGPSPDESEPVRRGGDALVPDATLDLPPLSAKYLTDKAAKELASVVEQAPPRTAKVDIYYPDVFKRGKATKAVIFGHAFVQPSYSYRNVIRDLREDGWLVVAPATDVFDVVGRDIGVKFDAKRMDIKLQSKLQSALIIDMLRSHEILFDHLEFKDLVDDVIFVGHSLGGACAIIAAAKVQADKIRGVTVMSPEVRQMQKTPVNDDIWLLNGDKESIKAAMQFFAKEFPADTALALISSKKDNIARPADIQRLFIVATESRQGEDVALFSIQGNHFGYEDELDLPNRVNFKGAKLQLGPLPPVDISGLEKPLTNLIKLVNKTVVRAFEWVQYKAYFLGPIWGNSPEQQPEALEVLKYTVGQMFARQELVKVPANTSIALLQPTPDDIDRVLQREPVDNTTLVPWIDTLLATYAGAQLLNSIVSLRLLLDSNGDFETKLGLLILSSLTLSLAYDNTILVSGRAIAERFGLPTLQALSKWRFLSHSGAPLAIVTGLNLAGRAGVSWAANPAYEGLIGLLILAVVGISSIRNSLFLEITPRWKSGVLRFSYDDGGVTDFTRVVPAIITSITLVVLGYQSSKQDSSLWPFFVGQLGALILNAVPSGKDGDTSNKPPMFILGNGGEVLLFLSLVVTEIMLTASGR
eukprot:GHUV01001064.1.p1 GENE.GHUV01001064.1~~GHUV01001064.1.p1  ORF type:complete len:693 (+),score=197.31 GHUV01001064.1:200-2278(+)